MSRGIPLARLAAWEAAEAWLCRCQGFITIDGQPFNPRAVDPARMPNPERRFVWNVGPAPSSSQDTPLVPRRSEDPYRLLDGRRNAPDGTGGTDEHYRAKYGPVDGMHAVRCAEDLQALVEDQADPLALDLLAGLGVAFATDLVDVGSTVHGQGLGSQLHRGHGWAGRICAVVVAHRSGKPEAVVADQFLRDLGNAMDRARMPNGGIIAWGSSSQKEVRQAREESGRPNLRIAQGYQMIILSDFQRHAAPLGYQSSLEFLSTAHAVLQVARKPGERANRYRYGVYDLVPNPERETDPDADELVPGPVPFDFAGTEALYASENQSEHHVPYMLAGALALEAEGLVDRAFMSEALQDYAQGKSFEELVAHLKGSLTEYVNAEEFVARLELRGSLDAV